MELEGIALFQIIEFDDGRADGLYHNDLIKQEDVFNPDSLKPAVLTWRQNRQDQDVCPN